MFDELNAKKDIHTASDFWKSTMQKYVNDKALAISFADYSYVYAMTKNIKNAIYFMVFVSGILKQ